MDNATQIKALDEVQKTAGTLLSRLFGPMVDEMGLTAADNFRVRRLKNQIRNFKKIEKIVEEEGLTLKQVDLKVLVPYLEGVAVEEDEELQNIWARLMANYLDSKRNLKAHVYPSILKQLSTDDVKILKRILIEKDSFSYSYRGWEIHPDLANLIRLNLVEIHLLLEEVNVKATSFINPMVEDTPPSIKYNLTIFAQQFLQACGVEARMKM